VINTAFTPSAEAVERSQAIVNAFAAAGNPGVVGIDGKMYDRPHLRLAERLLARAKASGT
ncbi:MAG: CoA ester lyase, partial [Mesorhizobium sp.]